MTLERIKLLGRGGFGVVYLVKNKDTNMLYALKKTNLNNFDAYNNEINILKKLVHKNIVKMHDHYKKDDYYNILLEYIDDGTLEAKINYKSKYLQFFNDNEIKRYIMQLADGLKYIHSFKIIHRDIKPGNLLITKNNILKISDFGVSREYNTMEHIKTFIGTPYYLAPEMIRGTDYDTKVDYWALGCIVYELITLKKPFDGKGIYSIINKINNGQYNLKRIPFKYQDLIKNLLNKNIKLRYEYKQINEFFYPIKLPNNNNPVVPKQKRMNEKSIAELYKKYNNDSFYKLGFRR